MSLGTFVADERVYPVASLELGDGAVQVRVMLTAEEAWRIPRRPFEWSLHGADGTFVCRGILTYEGPTPGRSDDVVELTLALRMHGKVALGV